MDWKNNDHCILATGFAQLPKGTPLYEMHKIIACVLIIDSKTDKIVDASFSFIMDLTNQFISSLIIGKSIQNGLDEIVKEIEKKYIASEQRAVIQTIRTAYDRYIEAKRDM